MRLTTNPKTVGLPLLAGVVLVSVAVAGGLLSDSVTPREMSVLTSLLLVVVTAVYAYLTYSLVIESRETRRRESAPVLALATDADRVVPEVLNVGNGPARRVEATLEGVADGTTHHETTVEVNHLGVTQSHPITDDPFGKIVDSDESTARDYDSLRLTGEVVDAFGDTIPVELTYTLDELDSGPRDPVGEPLQQMRIELERVRHTLDDQTEMRND